MRTVEIHELKHCWRAGAKCYSAAAKALNAIKRQDRRLAKETGRMAITEIVWKPTTSIGVMVAKSLGAAQQAENSKLMRSQVNTKG